VIGQIVQHEALDLQARAAFAGQFNPVDIADAAAAERSEALGSLTGDLGYGIADLGAHGPAYK